jgi:modification methylase
MTTSDATVPPKRRRKRTQTKSFGSSKRENHNADAFYQSRMYEGKRGAKTAAVLENPLPAEVENQLFCRSSEIMAELPDASVHLMITSPPYNASKVYDDDLSLQDYLSLLRRVFAETYRALAPGGRACINIANLGRSPYIPMHMYVIEVMLSLGYLMRGEIIWDKGPTAGISTAWGSWKSPTNPILRDTHEYILVFSKDSFSRKKPAGQEGTIDRDAFMRDTKSLWQFRSESAKRVGHPAPFPEELPNRLIHLYSFENDVVLDPFCGSGTTPLVAYKLGRRYVGYDLQPEYITLAERRLTDAMAQESDRLSETGHVT